MGKQTPSFPVGAGWNRSSTSWQPASPNGGLVTSSGRDAGRRTFPKREVEVGAASKTSPTSRNPRPNPTQGQRNPAPSGRGFSPAGAQRSARYSRPSHLAIVANEHHAVAWVNRTRTEITLLNPHVERSCGRRSCVRPGQTPRLRGSDVTPPREVILFPVLHPEKAVFLRSSGPPGKLAGRDSATPRARRQKRCRLAQAQSAAARWWSARFYAGF